MKDKIQMLLTICLFAYIIFLQQCKQGGSLVNNSMPKPDTVIYMDTTPPQPIVINLPRQQIPQPMIIYIDSSGRTIEAAKVDTTKHQKARLYQDSIKDENLTLYYKSTIDGRLLQNDMRYKLNVPKFITKTIEITKPVPFVAPVSTFLFNGGIGTDFSQLQSVTVGVQFLSSKGWALGYDYDILQNNHRVKLGVKLFQIKPKIK